MTMIIVTHEIPLARDVADRLRAWRRAPLFCTSKVGFSSRVSTARRYVPIAAARHR
jgi:ABC-type polar amino acid transport system ATPase subunit